VQCEETHPGPYAAARQCVRGRVRQGCSTALRAGSGYQTGACGGMKLSCRCGRGIRSRSQTLRGARPTWAANPLHRGASPAHLVGQSYTSSLGPVNATGVGGAGSQFFSVLGVRSDAYRVSASDDRRRNEENWPRPFGLRRKAGHTSFSPSTVVPPQPSGSASSGRLFARNAARLSSVNRP